MRGSPVEDRRANVVGKKSYPLGGAKKNWVRIDRFAPCSLGKQGGGWEHVTFWGKGRYTCFCRQGGIDRATKLSNIHERGISIRVTKEEG